MAAKEPRETEACLDPEAPLGLSGSPGSRDLGETPVTLVPEETQDSLAQRETPADLDSATQDPGESLEKKASQAHVAPRYVGAPCSCLGWPVPCSRGWSATPLAPRVATSSCPMLRAACGSQPAEY